MRGGVNHHTDNHHTNQPPRSNTTAQHYTTTTTQETREITRFHLSLRYLDGGIPRQSRALVSYPAHNFSTNQCANSPVFDTRGPTAPPLRCRERQRKRGAAEASSGSTGWWGGTEVIALRESESYRSQAQRAHLIRQRSDRDAHSYKRTTRRDAR